MSQQTHHKAQKPATSDPIGGNRTLQRQCACGKHTTAGGECDECRQKRQNLQRQATRQTEETQVPPVVPEVLSRPGQPLDTDTRQTMEAKFGQDLSRVRTHSDEKAADSAAAINAQAYTVGQDVVFGQGKLAPRTSEGQKLLAHELAHVTQQAAGDMAPATGNLTIGDESDALERAADKAADDVVSGEQTTDAKETNVSTAPPGLIQREIVPGSTDTTLRVSPFMARSMGSLTLTNFPLNSATLTTAHQEQVASLAGTISRLLRQYPGATISIVGHTDATGSEEHNLGLGQERADAVRDALVAAGVSADIITTSSAGEASLRVETQRAEGLNRRVEITFQPEPIAHLDVPPLTLEQPRPPIDLRFHAPPPTPESLEERVNRILREPIPEPLQRRSLSDLFWQRVNEGLDTAMRRTNVPEDLRPWIRRGVRAGIERGAEAIVDEMLDAANIHGEEREALKAIMESAAETPVFD